MTEETNIQGQQTSGDPLAQFMPQAQSAQPKFQFAGREFESREAAERWAYDEFESQKQREREAAAEAAAAREQAARLAQQQNQFVTGREQVGYDHAQTLRRLGESPEAIDDLINYRLFGTTKPAVGFTDLFKATAAQSARMSAQITEMQLKANHPEIPWHDPAAVQLISRTAVNGDYEGAIARLQVQGALPPPPRWQAAVQPPVAQGNTNQYHQPVPAQAPPMVGRTAGSPSNGMDYNAILEKLNDPSTSLEDGDRLIAALQQHLATNPSAGGQ